MLKDVKVAAFEGGQLRILASEAEGREAVLALPLSRILVKMVRVSKDEEAEAVAASVLKAMNPFPDDELTVSCETVSESESGSVLIASAVPESALDDVAEALDAAKLNVTRIDALALGELRGLWPSLAGAGRRLVLLAGVDCISLFVLDGDQPVEIRAITDGVELKRNVMLSLLAAEDFAGARKLDEIIWAGEDIPAIGELAAFAPTRRVAIENADAALVGVAERTEDAAALNALPASWREMLEETRFKGKLIRRLAVAGGIWLLIMGVLVGVPLGYGFMTDRQKSLCKSHAKQFKAVSEMRDKVKLVQKYSDHARGALEIMKALSDRLPAGIELSSWNYKREDAESGDGGVTVSGEAETANQVYEFKDAMAELAPEGEEKPLFGTVAMKGPTAGRGGKQKFDLDCLYKEEGAE